MELSSRISGLKPSATGQLSAKANQLAAEGHKIYSFAVGEPDRPTPDLVVDTAIASLKKGRTKYGPSGGGLALRQAISGKLKRDNQLSYPPDQIVAGMGAKEILFHSFMAILNEGDEVLVPAPYWVSYQAQIEACGGRMVVIPMTNDLEGGMLTPEMIEAYTTSRTKAILLTSPNNPAGYILGDEELQNLAAYLKNKPWWILSDEIYEYMAFDKDHVCLPLVEPTLSDRYLHINGLSKGFAMTGWRVGYLAGPSCIVGVVKTLQSHSSTCLPPFVEDAAVAALKEGPGLLGDMFKELQQRRDMATKLLDGVSGISYIPPEGAYYIYLDLRDWLASSQYKEGGTMAFSNMLLEKHHVAMVPGEAFGTPGFLRMSYALKEEDIAEGIKRLEAALA